jgi:hypothetical protein
MYRDTDMLIEICVTSVHATSSGPTCGRTGACAAEYERSRKFLKRSRKPRAPDQHGFRLEGRQTMRLWFRGGYLRGHGARFGSPMRTGKEKGSGSRDKQSVLYLRRFTSGMDKEELSC